MCAVVHYVISLEVDPYVLRMPLYSVLSGLNVAGSTNSLPVVHYSGTHSPKA